jgi:hypothetical protein
VGPDVFPSLPALTQIPLGAIRDWACILRNQAVQSPLAVTALFEAVTLPLLLASQPEHGIRAIVGNCNQETRKVFLQLGVPILYAPCVPVRLHTETGAGASGQGQQGQETAPYWWAAAVDEQGAFWPGVLACDDLRAHRAYLDAVAATLALPSAEIRRALLKALNRGDVPAPRALAPAPEETSVLWTSDPFYGLSAPAADQRAGRVAPHVVRQR